ncbi:MAG: sugar ABC transporter ATP-binding protein [Janthinobacterium lividum]
MTTVDHNRGAPVLELKGLGKSFPGVRALKGVDLSILAGEVHALCGENGAGKSTLMKILAGNIVPDEGSIRYQGVPYRPRSPLDAKRRGIILVHQEISLVADLSVAENLFLGALPTIYGAFLSRKELLRRANAILAECGYDIDPAQPAGELSIARQQMIEIARASATPCSVVIFDEPTAALTGAEARGLFANIAQLKARNVAVVYISHKMREIFELSDRITVLRDGETRGTLDTAATDEPEVMRLMIGRSLDNYFHRVEQRPGNTILEARGITVPGHISDASLAVKEGEILGLYGLVGSGRSELVEAIFGIRPMAAGQVAWRGKDVAIRSVRDAVELGIALVPEDRKRQGLVMGLGGRENIVLPILRRISRWSFMRAPDEHRLYADYRARLAIKVSGPNVRVGTLSGGNQQKFVLAKWLATNPKLLILDEPTRGVDVGAKAEIHALIGDLAKSGLAVILISSEMPEIMGVSHRILTLHSGRVTAEFDGATVTEDDLIAAVMGSEAVAKAAA